jgi:hypothetical protein
MEKCESERANSFGRELLLEKVTANSQKVYGRKRALSAKRSSSSAGTASPRHTSFTKKQIIAIGWTEKATEIEWSHKLPGFYLSAKSSETPPSIPSACR